MKLTIFIVIATATLAGCATNFSAAPSAEVANAIEVKDSSFDKDITYTGPQVLSDTRRGLFVDNETVRLAAVKNKTTGAVNYAVYVRILYSFDWRFYKSVSFKGGAITEVKNVSKQVSGCTSVGCIHTEEFVFLVSPDQLKAGGGLEFRANSTRGTENVITIPRSYIDGFFAGLPFKP